MGGLARIAKMYGAIKINGQRYVWDYVADEAVPEAEMPDGSDRWKASERKRWADVKAGMTADEMKNAAQVPPGGVR